MITEKNDNIVAASQPASGWPLVSKLTTYTSSLPPPHMGPGSVRPAFEPRGWSTGQPSQFTCIVYISTYHPNKASILSTAVHYCTCSYRYLALVGTVESVPVPPQPYSPLFLEPVLTRANFTQNKDNQRKVFFYMKL